MLLHEADHDRPSGVTSACRECSLLAHFRTRHSPSSTSRLPKDAAGSSWPCFASHLRASYRRCPARQSQAFHENLCSPGSQDCHRKTVCKDTVLEPLILLTGEGSAKPCLEDCSPQLQIVRGLDPCQKRTSSQCDTTVSISGPPHRRQMSTSLQRLSHVTVDPKMMLERSSEYSYAWNDTM